jgi:hypothetical protein
MPVKAGRAAIVLWRSATWGAEGQALAGLMLKICSKIIPRARCCEVQLSLTSRPTPGWQPARHARRYVP